MIQHTQPGVGAVTATLMCARALVDRAFLSFPVVQHTYDREFFKIGGCKLSGGR